MKKLYVVLKINEWDREVVGATCDKEVAKYLIIQNADLDRVALECDFEDYEEWYDNALKELEEWTDKLVNSDKPDWCDDEYWVGLEITQIFDTKEEYDNYDNF